MSGLAQDFNSSRFKQGGRDFHGQGRTTQTAKAFFCTWVSIYGKSQLKKKKIVKTIPKLNKFTVLGFESLTGRHQY